MAGDNLATVLLLGIGLEQFSMTVQVIPEIKKVLRNVTSKDAEKLAQKILTMDSHKEINAYIKNWMDSKIEKSYFKI
jgi:phosphotransferase system enzyme I (PtsI)